MKYIITILLTICVVTGVYAYVSPLQTTDFLKMEAKLGVTKVYDSNNGATCYIYKGYSNGEVGISCVK